MRLLAEIEKYPLDFFDNIKLHGTIIPASHAVSTPTIVPLGALDGTVKLLILIVTNLSAMALGPRNSRVAGHWLRMSTRPITARSRLLSVC
jgi:hypothetical protein